MFGLGLAFGMILAMLIIEIVLYIYVSKSPKYKLQSLKEKKKSLEEDNKALESIEEILLEIQDIKTKRKSQLDLIEDLEKSIKNLER